MNWKLGSIGNQFRCGIKNIRFYGNQKKLHDTCVSWFLNWWAFLWKNIWHQVKCCTKSKIEPLGMVPNANGFFFHIEMLHDFLYYSHICLWVIEYFYKSKNDSMTCCYVILIHVIYISSSHNMGTKWSFYLSVDYRITWEVSSGSGYFQSILKINNFAILFCIICMNCGRYEDVPWLLICRILQGWPLVKTTFRNNCVNANNVMFLGFEWDKKRKLYCSSYARLSFVF